VKSQTNSSFSPTQHSALSTQHSTLIHPSSFILLALLLRLAFAWFSVEVADTANYRRVAEILQQGGQLYDDTPGIYPYPPVWFLVEQGALWLAQHTFISFIFWVKLLPVLFDTGIVGLLHLLTCNQTGNLRYVSLLYAFNPLPILVCAFQGQFDSIPIFFCGLALYCFDRKTSYRLAALCLLVAVALKGFPVLLLPFFLFRLENWRQRLIFTGIVLLPVGLILLPFLVADFPAVGRELFGYSGYPDHGWVALAWGGYKLISPESSLGTTLQLLITVSKGLFLFGYAGLLYLGYRGGLARFSPVFQIALVFATFYALYGGLSSQYLLWLLPFLLLLNPKYAIIYSLLAVAALLAFYNYQWPVIIYRVPVSIPSKNISAGLWLVATGGWWLAVAVGLSAAVRRILAGRIFDSMQNGTQNGTQKG
jgi:hypothetical protein